MRQQVKQIAYKYCINFAKTELPYRHNRCVVIDGKNSGDSQDAINSIRRSANDGERATERSQ